MALNRKRSSALFHSSQNLFPGGVNSPVRAFQAVGGNPIFMKKGKGAYITDVDENRYIDFCMSFGPLILGHAPEEVVSQITEQLQSGTTFGAPTELENTLAELILSNHRYLEMIRFVNSGTEAAMSAIRLARGYTGRNKIIKFEGCYHGHVDSLLVNAGSGLATLGTSSSAGIPDSFVKETLVLPLNNKEAVLKAVEQYGDDIACIALEPIPANNGLLIQEKEFLQFLRKVCDEHGILLFFDEVISGFRVDFEGAAGYYNIQPDVLAFGKIIGGGLPVGAYGASKKVMEHVAPIGPVYQAGTLSGNPIAMAAGIAQLTACLKEGFYQKMAKKTSAFCKLLNVFLEDKELPARLHHKGSIFWINFSKDAEVRSADQIDGSKMTLFSRLHHYMLKKGVYLGPSGYEVGFISRAHTEEILTEARQKMEKGFLHILS